MTTQVASENTQENTSDERYGLFRKQAVEKQQDRLLGDVLVIPPLSYSLITAIILLFVTAGIVLLVNGTYARKETVQGFLVPDQGVIKVYANTSGIIRQVFIKENERVKEGQPLFVINGDRILENGTHLETILLDEYLGQQSLITAELNRLPELYDHKRAEIKQLITTTQRDVEHIQTQQALLAEQIVLANQQRQNVLTLREQGLASEANMDVASEKLISLKSQAQELARSFDAQTDQLKTLELQLSALAFDQLNEEGQLKNNLSSISQNIAQLHGQRAYIVKANRAGIVSNIQVSEGQEASTNTPLLTITPEGSQLQAELLVPARAIGFVEKGQSVKLRYSAFNFQKFGLYNATISNVSQSVLLPHELKDIAVNVQEPMYRITATLEQQTVDAYGKPLALKEGISLEADIKLAERTLMEWLFEPLLSLKGRL
jgi:membrane fusion protein